MTVARVVAVASLAASLFASIASCQEAGRRDASESDGATSGDAADTLPRIDELPLPTAAELLTGPPRDRVILNTGEVLLVEPLLPRPGTLEAIAAKREAVRRDPELVGTAEGLRKFEELKFLLVTLPDDAGTAAYRVRRDLIDRIEYHEELLLRRVDRLLARRDVDTAYELIDALLRDAPDWPGLGERRAEHLRVEASVLLDRGRHAEALRRSDQYRDARLEIGAPLPPDAVRVADAALAALVRGPLRRGDAVTAAATRNRLARRRDELPAVGVLRDEIAAVVGRLVESSRAAREGGDLPAAAAAIETAARIDPRARGLARLFLPITESYPRLHVAVVAAGDATATATDRAPRDLRLAKLLRAGLFEPVGFDRRAIYRGSLVPSWRPDDLGRRMRLDLREPLASAVATRIGSLAAAGPTTRFGHLFTRAVAVDPVTVEVAAARAPAFTPAVLVAAAPAFADGAFAPARDAVGLPDDLRGIIAACRGASASRRYVRTDGSAGRDGRLAEIVEHDFPDYSAAARAFEAGAVDAVVTIPGWDAARHDVDPAARVEAAALPDVYALFIDPEAAGVTGVVRRAVAFAVDLGAIVTEDVLLADSVPGRATDVPGTIRPRRAVAPWPAAQRGTAGGLEPREYDPALAATLLAIARGRGEGDTPLRFSAPDTPVARRVASRLERDWGRVGFDVVRVGPGERCDVALRVVREPTPAVTIAELLVDTANPTVDDLARWPVAVREPLLELERAAIPEEADAALARLHRALHAEAYVVPLVEVTPLRLVRRAVVMPYPGRSDFYVGADRWTLRRVLPEAPR